MPDGVIVPESYPMLVNGFQPGASFWYPFGAGCARVGPDGDLLLLCYPGAVWGCAADNDNDRPRPRPVT